jgi:hypothetical protein
MLLAASKVQGHLVNKACLYKIPHGSKWGDTDWSIGSYAALPGQLLRAESTEVWVYPSGTTFSHIESNVENHIPISRCVPVPKDLSDGREVVSGDALQDDPEYQLDELEDIVSAVQQIRMFVQRSYMALEPRTQQASKGGGFRLPLCRRFSWGDVAVLANLEHLTASGPTMSSRAKLLYESAYRRHIREVYLGNMPGKLPSPDEALRYEDGHTYQVKGVRPAPDVAVLALRTSFLQTAAQLLQQERWQGDGRVLTKQNTKSSVALAASLSDIKSTTLYSRAMKWWRLSGFAQALAAQLPASVSTTRGMVTTDTSILSESMVKGMGWLTKAREQLTSDHTRIPRLSKQQRKQARRTINHNTELEQSLSVEKAALTKD